MNPPKDHHVNRLTKYHVRPEDRPQLQKALADYVFQSLKAEGNIMAEAYFEREDSSVLWLIERWTNADLLASNERRSRGLTVKSVAKNALVSPPEVYLLRDLEPITREEFRRLPHRDDQPFTVMLFLEAKEGTQDNFKELYHTAMPKFRSEPGVVTYQLSEIEGHPTRFVTYEKFRSDAAFQYHLKFPPIEPIIHYLRTSIKDMPFEKGIHNLVEFAPLLRED